MPRAGKGKEIKRTSQEEREEYEDEPSSDDWNSVEDPRQRRQIQNKLAQRKYRERVRNEKEESSRQSRDRAAAGNVYSQLNPQELGRNSEAAGVPWGSFNMRHIVERGQAQEQAAGQQRSRESSGYFAQASTPASQTRTGYQATDYGAVEDPSSLYQGRQSAGTTQPKPSGQGGTYHANISPYQGSRGRGGGGGGGGWS